MELVRDVEFGRGGGRPLRMHLMRPEGGDAGPRPVVVFIHGGAWMQGSRDAGIEALAPLVDRGFIGASVEYRFSSEAIFPAQIHDCKCAVRFLRANAATLGIDPERIGAWGRSAGGHLATMLGTTAHVADLEGDGGWPGVSSRVQSVCDWFGPTDLVTMLDQPSSMDHGAADSPESRLVGGPVLERADLAGRANPITYIKQPLPPFLIMHGDADPLVPFNQSELLHEALKAASADVTFRPVPGGGHGGPAFELDWVRDEVLRFFERHLMGVSAPVAG